MKTCMFVIATKQYDETYRRFLNSLRKFHPDLEVYRINTAEIEETHDSQIFMRAKPYFACQFFDKGYELVIGADVDQIITGNLDRILLGDYEVGTVLNINRVDPTMYGLVSVGTINPEKYYNAGFVAMTSAKFARHWNKLCHSEHYPKFQYREQDLLNIICHYGEYQVTCFDEYDATIDYAAWHGLICKGEGMKMVMRDGELILPAQLDGYPKGEKKIKILHNAGGQNEKPIQEAYRTQFNEDVITYLTKLMEN